VTTVPTGSAVTTASLQNANTAKPSVQPDVLGDYVLTLTVTSGTAKATKTVTVHAVNAHVFYSTTKADDISPYFEYDVVQMDGTGPHAVSCRQRILALPGSLNDGGVANYSDGGASGSGLGSQFLGVTAFTADYSMDNWEGPPGTPARGAFSQVDFTTDAGAQLAAVSYLVAATSDTTCQNPPALVHAVTGSSPGVAQPRISPDGTRIAYLEQRSTSEVHFATVGFDGTDYHDFGNMCGDAGGSCSPSNYTLQPDRPQWIDTTHVAWLVDTTQTAGSGTFTIYSAPDTNNAPWSVYMTCAGKYTPRGFAVLKDGSILANYQAVGSLVEDLVVFGKDSSSKCVVKRNLTNLKNAYSYARDFSVSPDGTMVAYVQLATTPNELDSGVGGRFGGMVYLVPVDGSAAPAPAIGEALQAYFGPRWIAGGTRLAWNGSAPVTGPVPVSIQDSGILLDGGLPAMNVVLLDGGPVMHVAQSDPANELWVLGGGNGGGCSFQLCSASPGHSEVNLASVGVGGLIGLGLVFRRRGRKQR
jgi:hypothetical protein